MASSQQPPTKKAKLGDNDGNSPMLLFDTPRRLSMAELYNPQMVTVLVCDEKTNPNAKQEFRIPRGLICECSDYFKAQAESGLVELTDVSPNTFKCFVGWLYCHRIFVDQPKTKPASIPALTGAVSGVSEAIPEKQPKRPGTRADLGGEQNDHGNPAGLDAAFGAQTMDNKPQFHSSIGAGASKADVQQASSHASSFVTTALTPRIISGDDLDPDDAVTWYWHDLFKLYIFADKYSARDFRMQVFTTIQYKFRIVKPQPYLLPDPATVELAVTKCSATSPLYRLLVDIYGIVLGLKSLGPTPDQLVVSLSSLPSDFLAASLVSGKRCSAARRCPECLQNRQHEFGDGHSSEDGKPVRLRNPCHYHEHGDNVEEAKRCALQWELWEGKGRLAQAPALFAGAGTT